MHRISREASNNQFVLPGLKPYTMYSVGIQTQDAYSQNSTIVYKTFQTKEAGRY